MNRHNWNNLSESTKRALREQELPADLQPRKGIPLNNPKVPYRPGFNPNTGQDYSNPCQDLGIGCDGAPLLYLPTNEEMENWGWTEPLQEWFQQHHNNGGQWYWDDGGFHFIANGEVVGGFANGVWTHDGVVMELHRSFRGRRQWLSEQGGGIVPPPGGTPPQGMQLSTSNPRRPYAKPRDLSAGSGFYSMPSGQWDWENFVEYIQGSGGFPLGDYTMQDLWNAAGQAGAAFDWSQFGFQYYADYDIWGVALGTPPGSAGFINLQYGEGGWNLYTAIP